MNHTTETKNATCSRRNFLQMSAGAIAGLALAGRNHRYNIERLLHPQL